MEEVLQALASFFVYAVVAVFAQNAVFTRAVQLISAPLGYFASGWISQLPYRDYIRPLVFLGCAAVAFFVVLLFSVVIFRVDGARRAVAVLPMATFNTCLLGTLLISSVQNFNFAQTLGFALGSGIGYVLAVHAFVHWHSGAGHLRVYRPHGSFLSRALLPPWRSREKYFMCGSPAAAGTERKARQYGGTKSKVGGRPCAVWPCLPLQPHGAAARGV